MLRLGNKLSRIPLPISLALTAGLIFVGCQPERSTEEAMPSAPTPWPTLVSLATTELEADGSSLTLGPQLIDKFRVDIQEGAVSLFPLEGRVEQPVRIEVIVLEGQLDPSITLSDGAAHRLAFANSGGPNEPEIIGQIYFPGDAYYELGIGAESGSGQVGVSIYGLEPAELESAGLLTPGEELHGRLPQPGSYHTFRISLARGQRIDVTATALSPDLDLLFELYGPDGRLLAARDDTINKDPALWNFMPNQSGTYIIVLSNFDERTGEYALSVTQSASGGEAAVGTRTGLELSGDPRRSTWLTFQGEALQAFQFEARPVAPGVDIAFDLYDPFGNRIISANFRGPGESEELSFVQLPFDGPYQIEFTTLGEGGAIEYLIRPTRAEDDELGGRIALSIFPHKGSMDQPGSLIVYTFDANAGDLIGVAARAEHNSGLDLGFDIYGPDGSLLATHDDDVGVNPVADRIELPLAGRYAVALWNYGATTGSFEIVIANPEAPVQPPDAP